MHLILRCRGRGLSALYPAGQSARGLARLFVARTLRLGGDRRALPARRRLLGRAEPGAGAARRTGQRLALIERAGVPRRVRRRLVRVAPLLAPVPDRAAFLAGGLGAEEHAAMRAGERTGRPLGSAAFIARLGRTRTQAGRLSTRRRAHRPELSIVSPELGRNLGGHKNRRPAHHG